MTRTMRIWLAVLAVLLGLLGYSRIRGHGDSPTVEQRTAGATEEATGDEPVNGSVQTTEGDPVGSGGRRAAGTSRGKQGSSSTKGSLSAESLPEGTISRGFEIAFTRYTGQGGPSTDIFLMNVDGSDLRKLRAGAEPEWSRDGKLIAFTSGQDSGNIQLMNADGSGLQNLRVRGFSPTWSPNGGQLAFAWECHGHQSGEACSLEGGWPSEAAEDCGPECGIGVVARDGTGVRRLGDGIYPDWGPDGRIMFADGIPTGPCYYDQGVSWTRVGHTTPPCELPIWVVNPDGSGRIRLPVDKAIRPTWSRDGRRIAYSTATDGIFIANSDGTAIQKVAPAGYTQPSWSPDGLWLALRGYTPPYGNYQNAGSIYLRAIDGSAERRLTSGPYDFLPAFSPRG